MTRHNSNFETLSSSFTSEELHELRTEFIKNDEFIVIPEFVPRSHIEKFLDALEKVRKDVHRSYIPNHKKGGSIPRSILKDRAAIFDKFYLSPEIVDFFSLLSNKKLLHCPDDDLHACALYLYTETGDHIDFHFDKSYYLGQRYTALIGLINKSNCLLDYELFHKNSEKKIIRGSTAIAPGALVFFNGDKLKHRITPASEGEERVVLTLEYVTNRNMTPVKRFVSNMKDAIAYFGFRKVFNSRKSD